MSDDKPVRFSRASVRDALVDRAMYLREKYQFNLNTGTVQLRPANPHKKWKEEDIDRAVAYGECRFCLHLASWIKDGSFPKEN